jgi:hypothetical protein
LRHYNKDELKLKCNVGRTFFTGHLHGFSNTDYCSDDQFVDEIETWYMVGPGR